MSGNLLVEAALSALEPFVGRMAAETCIRATALSAGKTSDDLSNADLQSLDISIRRLLAPIAAAATIESILDEIHMRAA